MKIGDLSSRVLICVIALMLIVPMEVLSQENAGVKTFKSEELDQMLAPIALYPDSLLAQVLMASTYPLEVVAADRWAKQNKELKGDALAEALEKQDWDPSVKSLVQFPDVLAMMSEKLEWTQKLGDAFLSQQEDVTNAVQNLRKKAEDAGNLKTTKEQVVKVEKEVIFIESASPQVVYVPVYNPTVVYGTWWWPAYPPYYYYPPYYPRPALYGFTTGVAIGVAWGYAWGHWNWHQHHVNVNINQNININRNINRDRYVQHYGGRDAQWRHNPEHRKGVSYRDQNTARQFNRAATNDAIKSRENFRGRAEEGRRDISRGDADRFKSRDAVQTRDLSRDRDTSRTRDDIQSRDRTPSRDVGRGDAGGGRDRGGSAFSGMDRGGGATRDISNRGSISRQSMSSGGSGGSRGGGMSPGGGGGSRGGGGGRGGRR